MIEDLFQNEITRLVSDKILQLMNSAAQAGSLALGGAVNLAKLI